MSTQKNIEQTTEQATPSQNKGTSKRGLSRRQFLGRSVATATLAMPLLAACETGETQTPVPVTQAPATEAPPTAAPPTAAPPTAAPPTAAPPTAVPVKPATQKRFTRVDFGPGYLRQPPLLSSNENGILDIQMYMASHPNQACYVKDESVTNFQKFDIGTATLGVISVEEAEYTDDKFYPAPTLCVSPGDTVKINLINKLSYSNEDECSPDDPRLPNCEHGFNTTNLHYHGSHVMPNAPGDNIFLQIKQDKSFQYEFQIHSNQAAGTHWYHPHKHGATALHVINGMAGALIVEGDLEFAELENYDIKDIVLVLQQIANKTFGGGVIENHPTVGTWINGEANPIIPMEPGEIQRWRIISATMKAETIGKVVEPVQALSGDIFGLSDFTFWQIAQDGVPFTNDQLNTSKSTGLAIFPGNRIDYLVQAPKDPITTTKTIQVQMEVPKVEQGRPIPGEYEIKNMFRIEVNPKSSLNQWDRIDLKTTSLTNKIPYPEFLTPHWADKLYDENEGLRRRCLVYGIDLSDGGHYIDGKAFNPTRVDHCMVLGTAEEWTIYNINSFAHPFHIHINPFFVTDVYDPTKPDGQKLSHPNRWQDTVLLPPAKYKEGTSPFDINNFEEPGYVIIRHEFIDFTGKFVNHCHFLDHEDEGMMQIVEIMPIEEMCPDGTKWQDNVQFPRLATPEVRGGLPDGMTLYAKEGSDPNAS